MMCGWGMARPCWRGQRFSLPSPLDSKHLHFLSSGWWPYDLRMNCCSLKHHVDAFKTRKKKAEANEYDLLFQESKIFLIN